MKKFYFLNLRICVVFILIILLLGCRKEKVIEALEPPKIVGSDSVQVIINGEKPQFRTRIYIIDEETADQVISITRNRIVIKKGAVLRGGEALRVNATDIKENEILAAGITSRTPNGLNRKVKAVRETKLGTELEIDTEDASFEDIFKNASFTLKHSFEANISLEHTFERSAGGGVSGELKTSGSASVEVGFVMPIEVENYSLKKIEAKAVVDFKTKLSISATAQIATGPLEVPVFSKKFLIVAIVSVGFVPFPIVLTPKLDLSLIGEAGLEGRVSFNAIDSESLWELGSGYEKGKGSYPLARNEAKNDPFSIEGELKGYMETGLKTIISITFYDLDYVTVGDEVKFFARVEGKCSSEGKGKADISINGGVVNTAFVKFDLFGYNDNKLSNQDLEFAAVKLKIPAKLCGEAESEGEIPNETNFGTGSSSISDPHLRTIDNANFDFMGVGEFIAVKSLTDNFEIQVRQGELKSLNDGEYSFLEYGCGYSHWKRKRLHLPRSYIC